MTEMVAQQPDRERRSYAFGNMNFEWNTEDISRSVDWYHHEEHHLVILHLSGRMKRLETEIEGLSTSFGPPNAGEVWIVPAGQRYASAAVGEKISYGLIRLDPNLVDRLIKARDIAPRQGVFDPFMLHGVQRLMDVADRQDDVSALMAGALSHTLSLHLIRTYGFTSSPVQFPSSILEKWQVRMIREYIHDNLSETLTLEVLSGVLKLPPHRFLEGFRQAFCTSPAQYVINERLRRAQNLLTSTRLSITEIAVDTGFASHSHLCSRFSNRYGCTPGEFRKSVKAM